MTYSILMFTPPCVFVLQVNPCNDRPDRMWLHRMAGHSKAVAYVRFTDGGEVMSASTDSTLRLWDLQSEVRTLRSATASSCRRSCCLVCIHHQVCSIVNTWNGSTGPCHLLLQMCTRIYRGHQNEKNFVGMSVDGEFIACGSEQNEV